jgi:hypothetical protein
MIVLILNPNPHCFIDVSNGWLAAEKAHYYPTPCTQCTVLWGGRGKGGATSTALKICLIKRALPLNYHQKHTEKDNFNENLFLKSF